MERRRIGELEVSAVGLGCNQLGTTCDRAASNAVVGAALDAGITFFDTADEYGDGRSEELLGAALRHHRDDVVIATKFGGPRGETPLTGASAAWIETAVEQSLTRLGTDRIDLYQLHFPDPATPIEETLEALGRLVAAGKVREIGAANLSGEQLTVAAAAADRLGVPRFASAQNRLNLLRQDALDDVLPVCGTLGSAFLPYFPLASGLLSGKYRRGVAPEAGTRMAESVPEAGRERILSDATFDRLDALERLAAEHGRTLIELAFGWLLAQPALASVIAGATRPEQVVANVDAARWRPDPELVAAATRAAVA